MPCYFSSRADCVDLEIASENISRSGRQHRDLSTALPRISCLAAVDKEIRVRFGRDDKMEGGFLHGKLVVFLLRWAQLQLFQQALVARVAAASVEDGVDT